MTTIEMGIGLKPEHYQTLLDHKPIDWLEFHPENYLSKGGLHRQALFDLAMIYPMSMHGVGLSLGSAEGIDQHHLKHIKSLADTIHPVRISEHIAWSSHFGHFSNDLLPLPYTEEAIRVITKNIQQAQDILETQILIENPSSYLMFSDNQFDEPDFLNILCQEANCRLLLDVNNMDVSCHNHQWQRDDYLNKIDFELVNEIHLAGHSRTPLTDDHDIWIDDHGQKVHDSTWQLFEQCVNAAKHPIATCVEWDTDVPDLNTLVDESQTARRIWQQRGHR